MKSATNPYKQKEQINTYLVKEITEATPFQLVMKVYDYAIQNCKKHDFAKTNKAIGLLIEGLNFERDDTREIATGLFKLYQFAQEEMRKKNFDIVLKILTDLREAWMTSNKQLQKG